MAHRSLNVTSKRQNQAKKPVIISKYDRIYIIKFQIYSWYMFKLDIIFSIIKCNFTIPIINTTYNHGTLENF